MPAMADIQPMLQRGLMVRVDLIRRFARLGSSRQMLVVEAILTLAVAAAAVAFAPYRRAVKLGSRPLAARRQSNPEDIVWSVNAASARVPWRAMCFERGLALQWMLRRRGHDARLVYGARMKEQSGLDAHVWVTLDDRILIGGEEAETYGSLATHPECFASFSTAKRRLRCSTGPRRASQSLSANGSVVGCGHGQKICSNPAKWRGTAGSGPTSSSGDGRIICPENAIPPERFGRS